MENGHIELHSGVAEGFLLQTIAGCLNYVSLNAYNYTAIRLHEFVSSPLYKDLQKGRLAP